MSALTAPERRYLLANAHAARLHAAACAASAEADLLNPWTPRAFNERCAEQNKTQAAYWMDCAIERETEATEEAA